MTSYQPWIIHQTEHYIVINKPPGMLSVPGRDPDMPDAIRWARAQFGEAYETHRLDMATSGLLIIALDKATERYFKQLFQTRSIQKHYRAIVHGKLSDPCGEIDLPLRCDWPNRPRQMVCHDHGKPSQTQFEVLSRSGVATEVELTPITGRSHQLRVHLQAIGHPIIGDELYATNHPVLANRLLLQAYELRFVPPGENELITLTLSPDFQLTRGTLTILN